MVRVRSGSKPEQPERRWQCQKSQLNGMYRCSGRVAQGHRIVPAVQRYGSIGRLSLLKRDKIFWYDKTRYPIAAITVSN